MAPHFGPGAQDPARASPHGVFAVTRHEAMVTVGTDHDTAASRGQQHPGLVDSHGPSGLSTGQGVADHRRRGMVAMEHFRPSEPPGRIVLMITRCPSRRTARTRSRSVACPAARPGGPQHVHHGGKGQDREAGDDPQPDLARAAMPGRASSSGSPFAAAYRRAPAPAARPAHPPLRPDGRPSPCPGAAILGHPVPASALFDLRVHWPAGGRGPQGCVVLVQYRLVWRCRAAAAKGHRSVGGLPRGSAARPLDR